MPTPGELTGRFMNAYNERDRETLSSLLPPELEYVRPGGGTLRTADEVMDQYERDWAVMSSSSVEVRELFESGDGIIAEVTIGATINGRSFSVKAALAHRWLAGRLIRYRLYSDPLPAEVSAVQPPARTSR
jgi:ketosteroid isomerase-like protein